MSTTNTRIGSMMDPRKIEPNDNNGRFKPVGDEAVNELIESIKVYGQLQPIGVCKTPKGLNKVSYGSTRHAAFLKMNEGLEPTDPNYNFIKVVTVTGNDTDQFLKNLQENLKRNNLTPMCHAKNIERLRDIHGMKDAKIAELYNKSQPWVSMHRQLLNLVTEAQDKVYDGSLSLTDALALAKLDYEDQRKTIGVIVGQEQEIARELGVEPAVTTNTTDGSTDVVVTPEVTVPVAADQKDAKAKAAKVSKRVTKKIVAAATKSVKTFGPRTRTEFVEMLNMVSVSAAAFSKRMVVLTEVLFRALEGRLRDDKEVLQMLDMLVNDQSIDTTNKLFKEFGKAEESANGAQ